MTKEIKKQIQEIADKIVEKYQPEKIILFGSYAWGKPHKNSDIDLFVIKESKNTRQLAKEIDGSIFPRQFPIDLIVYEPKNVSKRLRMEDFFITDIMTKGKVLYG